MGCSSGEDFLNDVSQNLLYADSGIVNNSLNDSLGRINAVKKAYQMTDLHFTPKKNIKGNGSLVYYANRDYQGLIYSSVKEMATFVGEEVSMHTFMTAVHNPKSRLYTEDVSKSPYHGVNCRAYYGTVCSGLVSYALGLYPRCFANDIPLLKCMEEINFTNPENIQVADVLWKNGHVALISDVIKDNDNKVLQIEISESVPTGCRRYHKTRSEFLELVTSSFKKVYRYTDLYKNTQYSSLPQFVAVLDEAPIFFQYNDDLCVDKGDKSCYLEGEEVIVNAMHSYDYMEIYKDNELYKVVNSGIEDVILTGLPYGDYKARIIFDDQYSDFTYWKTVNVNVKIDREEEKVYFCSKNAIPQYVRSLNISGECPNYPSSNYGYYFLTDEDVAKGFIDINNVNILPQYPYIRVYFSTEYGTIINTPLNWNEE